MNNIENLGVVLFIVLEMLVVDGLYISVLISDGLGLVLV